MTDTAATPIKRSWRNNRLLRLLILFVTLMVIYAVAQELGERSLPKFAHLDAHMSLALGYGLGVAASLAAYVWLVHVLERRFPIGELAPRKAPGGLLAGFLLGVGIISAVIGVMWLMGAATLALNTPPLPSFAMVAVAIVSAVCEELIFRGALFRIPEEMFGTLVAIVISGLLFGGAHIVNPHANWASSTAIVIEAGPLFGLAYAATRSLWLPMGLHFGWNLAEGGIFSTSVSGDKIDPGVFMTALKGPDIVTGGAFGPEASVIAVGVCTVLTIVFAVITIRRGEWKGLRLRIRATQP